MDTPPSTLDAIREDFPFLDRRIQGRPIIYFDNAATSQKPRPVINSIREFYEGHCANIHRGAHRLSEEASDLYEQSRGKVARFLGCDSHEVIFVRNATEAINLAARGLPGDGDVLSPISEHHSNLLPWRERRRLRLAEVDSEGSLDLDDFASQLTSDVDLVAISHVANGLGVVNPVAEVVAMAAANGSLTLIDASQSVGHLPIDVRTMGCDLLAFSGHKVMAPSGIGVLYARFEILETIQEHLVGGGTVKKVDREGSTPQDIPWRFEAGTPNIEGAIGLGVALEYVESLGLDWIAAHDRAMITRALNGLRGLPNVEVHGPQDEGLRCSSVAFTIKGVESQVVARILSDRFNVMVRSGLHCAHPLHATLGIGPTVRASFGVYNSESEVDLMIDALGVIARLG